MQKRKFLVPIAVALSALSPSASGSFGTAMDLPPTSAAQNQKGATSIPPPTAMRDDLFGFVLKQGDGGEIFAGHRSHRSHSSHRSHYSSR